LYPPYINILISNGYARYARAAVSLTFVVNNSARA